MRTKQRLTEIIRTVNPDLYPNAALWFLAAADELSSGDTTIATTDHMHFLAGQHASEYVRELAKEVIHYIWGDQA